MYKKGTEKALDFGLRDVLIRNTACLFTALIDLLGSHLSYMSFVSQLRETDTYTYTTSTLFLNLNSQRVHSEYSTYLTLRGSVVHVTKFNKLLSPSGLAYEFPYPSGYRLQQRAPT